MVQPLTAAVTRKGQVTIPVEIRRFLGVAPRDRVVFLVEAGQVRIAPATSVVARTAGMLASDRPRLTSREEKIAAEEAMAGEAIQGRG